jgi:hypothetical protein
MTIKNGMTPGIAPLTHTALEALTCLFFGDDVSIADALRKPLAPSAALMVCLIAGADETGITRREAQFGLRFAFNPEEANQIATAGFAAAIDAGLLQVPAAAGGAPAERLHLTERGQRMADVLRQVLAQDEG